MIDWVRVADLRNEVGNDGFEEVVMLFMEETDEAVRRLEAGVPAELLGDMLHFLKGSALNLGFRAVSRLCHEGERLAAEGHAEQIDLNELVDNYKTARTEFLSGLSRLTQA